MKLPVAVCLTLAAGVPLLCFGQLNKTRGNAPGGVPQATYFIHRLGSDHAEGITTIDMNGDGKPDLLSGAYWYENPGAARRGVDEAPVPHCRYCRRICF